MSQNMYRVGDYVYFEVFPSSPYQIRRIEELNKTPNGTVEAKVICFYRRRDLPTSLLRIADQAERQDQILSRPKRSLLSRPNASPSNGDAKEENGTSGPASVSSSSGGEGKDDDKKEKSEESDRSFGYAGLPAGAEALDTDKLHALRQRELFLSRQMETLPATQIRGKCTVVMLSEVETADMYLDRDDAFFYSLVFDPTNQTLLADKGKIDIGDRHQAELPELQKEAKTDDGASAADADDQKENGDLMMVEDEEEEEELNPLGIRTTERETVVYHPHHNLSDRDIDQFLIIARAVGTFSRALDSSATMKLPSLHMTAAAASRDVTLLHAMALLHQANYDIGQATKYLVPPPSKQHYPLEADKVTSHNTISLGGPILCRDQLEEWSASEASIFEDAIDKYGKDFHDIRADCLPWKSIRDIVEYYYMWKTTARYTDQQKTKSAEAESKLKQVYIPSYNKPNPNLVGPVNTSGDLVKSVNPCESCKVEESTHWYAWGPAHLQLRLCSDCWSVWKKRGGLKRPHEYEGYDLDGVAASGKPGSIGNRGGSQWQQARGGPVRSNGAQAGARPLPGQLTPQQIMLAPKSILNIRKSARSPFKAINEDALRQYYYSRDLMEIMRVCKQIRGVRFNHQSMELLKKLHDAYGRR